MTKYVSMSIRLSSFVLLAALIGGATQAQAQSYPTKPVKIISDSAPGSAVDTNLRTHRRGSERAVGSAGCDREPAGCRRCHFGDGRSGGRTGRLHNLCTGLVGLPYDPRQSA